MSHQDVALRQRCARLLQALLRIEAWQNSEAKDGADLETFAMMTKGCAELELEGLLEAPIYSNSQIEAAWLFLFEVRRRHFNRRMQIQDCTRILGSSHNWSMVLFGSKKIHESLRNMPPEACMEILEDAKAMELQSVLQRSPMPQLPAGGFMPQTNGGPAAPGPGSAEFGRGKKNPFKETAAADPAVTPPAWPQSDPAPAPVANAGWPGTAGEPPAPAPQWPSAPSNPFRKEAKEEKSEAAEMQVTPQDMMAGAKFAQDSGLSAKDMMTGARYAQQSGITPQHALDGARMAHQAGVRPQHVVQGAQMAHQAGLRPQHFVQGAKAAQQAGVTPQHVLAAGKAFAGPPR